MTATYAMTAGLLLIGLVLMLADAASKLKHSPHRRISTVLIASTMAYVALDCLWIMAYLAQDYDRGLFAVLNALFYLMYITLPYIWFLFAQHFAGALGERRGWRVIFALPWAANLVMVLLTLCGTGTLWTIGDSASRYARGPLFELFCILNLLYYYVPVLALSYMLISGKSARADRRTLWTTLGFCAIPAIGVTANTYFIALDQIYPVQPCCFFIGVMFAYISLITQLQREADAQNARLSREAEAARRIEELSASVASLLTNMPALTFSKDVENGRYMACNQLFAEYANKADPSGVVGLTDFEIFDHDTAAHFVEDDKKALAMDEPYIFYEDVPDAAGRQHQFQTTKLKFTDTMGRLCTLGMCVDVTQVVTLQRENAQERQANQAKSTFLSNMSHDIRTPMNAIIGFTDLAMKEADDPQKTREYLGKIKASSDHLLSLINDVLEMSRIESGKIALNEAPCSLTGLLDDLNTIILGQAQAKGQQLQIKAELRDDWVYCDRLRMNQILLNLLSNAVKYTPEGGHIAVELRQLAEDAPGRGAYQLRVRDDGIGMSREFAARVFDAFERENTSTVSGIQGTGLGMAITKRIVDLMGGSITVDTAPGAGSTFTVRFSLRLAEAAEAARHAAEEIDLTGKRALLADDIAINREIAAMLLQARGMTVEQAADGAQALELIKAAAPGYYDVVLMDIQMPVLDGYAATQAIRALDAARAGVPIIAMTANAFEEDRRRALECGMNAHVAKPIDEAQLLRTVAEAMGNKC